MSVEYQGGGDGLVFQHFQPLINIMQNNDKMRRARELEERKQRDKLTNELSKDMAKLNSAGIRELDLPEFYQELEKAKDAYFQASRATSAQESQMYAMKVNEHLGVANYLKEKSKADADKIYKMSSTIAGGVGKMRVDDAKAHLKRLMETKSTDLKEADYDLSNFYYTYDNEKSRKDVRDLVKTAFNNPNVTTTTTEVGEPYKVGHRLYSNILDTRQITEAGQLEILSNLYKTNRNFQNKVDSIINTGVKFNDAIAVVAEEYSDLFTSTEQDRVDASERRGSTINVDNRTITPQTLGDKKRLKLGMIDTPDAWTYNKDVGLQGEVKFYNPDNLQLATQGRTKVNFRGYNIVVLPVDEAGNPVPEGSSKAVRMSTFMTGAVTDLNVSINDEALDTKLRALLQKDVLIPYNEMDNVYLPKAERGITTQIRNYASEKQVSKGTSNSQQTSGTSKKLSW